MKNLTQNKIFSTGPLFLKILFWTGTIFPEKLVPEQNFHWNKILETVRMPEESLQYTLFLLSVMTSYE